MWLKLKHRLHSNASCEVTDEKLQFFLHLYAVYDTIVKLHLLYTPLFVASEVQKTLTALSGEQDLV